jgi:hypothetical protein
MADRANISPTKCHYTLTDREGWLRLNYKPTYMYDPIGYAASVTPQITSYQYPNTIVRVSARWRSDVRGHKPPRVREMCELGYDQIGGVFPHIPLLTVMSHWSRLTARYTLLVIVARIINK